MEQRIRDMTQGSPGRLIFSFALPLMLGNICQQMYTLVDTAVVGQFVGVEALAALGAAEWLVWLVLGVISGFAQGFGILMAQRFGAGDAPGLRRAVSMSVLLGGSIALVFTLLSQLTLEALLALLNTPAQVVAMSALYLHILFGGILAIMAYNILSALLRSLGDSKTPLYAMVLAAVINITLDLLFVLGLGWGVAGAAAATVIAQTFSAVYCLLAARRVAVLRMSRKDWEIDGVVVRRLVLLGAPMAAQNAIIAVGGMALQRVINGFGFVFVAGFTATNKLYGLLEMAAISYGYSMATFAGQNLGAGKYARIRDGMRVAIQMGIATALSISAVMLLFGRKILALFIDSSAATAQQVMNIAYTYLVIMSVLLFVLYLLHLYRSALQGMGDTVMPMVSGIFELVMRVGCALVLPIWMGENGIFYAEVAAWTGAVAVLVPSYYIRLKKVVQGSAPAPQMAAEE